MANPLKTFLAVFVLVTFAQLAGCKEELAPASVIGHDKTGDASVIGFTIDDKFSAGIGGEICCVMIPSKWHPGIRTTISWAEVVDKEKHEYRNYSETVEIPPYSDRVGNFHVVFIPGHRVKAFVSLHDMGSPFFPLSRKDAPQMKVDYSVIRNYIKNKHEFFWADLTKDELEWAKQWGIVDGKCTDPDYLAWEKAMLEAEKQQQTTEPTEEQ